MTVTTGDKSQAILRFDDGQVMVLSEHAALVELLKGRTTTMREAHTGEGIFFTLRVADRFVLRGEAAARES